MRDVGTIKTESAEVEALSVEELRTLRAFLAADKQAVRGDIVDAVDFMMGTATRIGEVLALRWGDVHLKAAKPYIDVVATVVYVKGSGATIQTRPKPDPSYRRLDLPTFVVEMLAARDRIEGSDLVFPSVDATVRDPNYYRKQLRRAVAGTAFEGLHPHVFRASVATLLDDLDLASAQLGHPGTAVTAVTAFTAFTEKHYTKRRHEGPDVRTQLQMVAATN